MDIGSLATAFVTSQTAQIQLAVAAAMLRANMQAEKNAAEVIAAAQENAQAAANIVAGAGGGLDVYA